MLLVKALEKLTASLKPSEFRKQLGPFVLIQRPPTENQRPAEAPARAPGGGRGAEEEPQDQRARGEAHGGEARGIDVDGAVPERRAAEKRVRSESAQRGSGESGGPELHERRRVTRGFARSLDLFGGL